MTSKSAPMTDTAVTALLDAYDEQTNATPLGHEMPTRGASTYNWRRSIVGELRALAVTLAAAPKPQGDDLEPVADDLVERLRAHEGIGAAMAPTHGTGRYVCAIMDEAASALQSLKAERDAALEAEDEAKDCFWAIYPEWMEFTGGGISTEAARTKLAAENATLKREIAGLREALTPSGDTKAAYIGEFSFTVDFTNEDGEDTYMRVDVPWITVKEIMAAILDRATQGAAALEAKP